MTMDDYVTGAVVLGAVAYVINAGLFTHHIRSGRFPKKSLQIARDSKTTPSLAYYRIVSNTMTVLLACLLLFPRHPQTAALAIACMFMLALHHYRHRIMRRYLESQP